MKRLIVFAILILLLGLAIFAYLRWRGPRPDSQSLPVLYGNIEIRDAQLAFNSDQKVTKVLVDEGDHVTSGQLLAQLDASRIEAEVASRQAAVAAAEQALLRLRNGTRPEEIDRARAALQVAEVRLTNAERTLKRVEETVAMGAVSRQELDNALALRDSALADRTAAQATLHLAEIGPRQEDIAEAAAQLDRLRADLQLSTRRLADTQLFAPSSGVIRTRVIEPGEMISPSQPAFTLSLTDQKWVRAYVTEPDLGRVKPGMPADIISDSFPERPYSGWVGHISPEAEFTPKNVQTQELRTALVYEVRVYVGDPADELRLGMPVTVHLHAAPTSSPSTLPTTQASAREE